MISPILTEIVNEKGAKMLLERQSLLFADPKLDVSAEVIKKLNKKFEILLNSLKGQALHASTLGFMHPKNSKIVEFKSDLPAKFKKLLFFLDKLDN